MKKIIVKLSLVMLSLSLSAEVINLGELGPSQEIIEEDLREVAKRKLSNIEYGDQKSKIIESIEKLANIKSELPDCIGTKETVQKNIVYLKRDYEDFGGNVIFSKGTPQIQKYSVASSICVVNGAVFKTAKRSISRLLEIGKCDKIMVANADFRTLQDDMKEAGRFYPYVKDLTESMHIRCLPSRSEAHKELIKINEISIGELQ